MYWLDCVADAWSVISTLQGVAWTSQCVPDLGTLEVNDDMNIFEQRGKTAEEAAAEDDTASEKAESDEEEPLDNELASVKAGMMEECKLVRW